MIREEKQVTVVTFRSAVMPNITSTRPGDAPILEWADAHPKAWKLVTQTKSKRNGSDYIACGRGESTANAIYRLAHVKNYYERGNVSPQHSGNGPANEENIFWWRARFAVDHYGEKGFRSVFLMQIDTAGYSRGCMSLDVTSASYDEAVDRFLKWCGNTFETAQIRDGERIVRDFKPVKKLARRV